MRKGGFTLIELLIVVAIIGILGAIAVPNFLNAQTKAKLAHTISNMKAIGTAMMMYKVDYNSFALHDPAHNYNILNNGLTTPVAFIAKIPTDLFQATVITLTSERLSGTGDKNPELHPEPFYAPAYGNVGLDTSIPALNSGGDLTLRFQDNPELFQKARGSYPEGRYIVSIGPDLLHTYPGTFDISNGLTSRGDIIFVIP